MSAPRVVTRSLGGGASAIGPSVAAVHSAAGGVIRLTGSRGHGCDRAQPPENATGRRDRAVSIPDEPIHQPLRRYAVTVRITPDDRARETTDPGDESDSG